MEVLDVDVAAGQDVVQALLQDIMIPQYLGSVLISGYRTQPQFAEKP
jgi:hypothetical protein